MTTPTPPEGRIATEQRGHLLLMQIDRPAKRNGFTPAMYRQLAEAYTRLDDDPALRVGVLHAAGEHFTAGLDLPSFAPLMQRGERAFPDGLVDPTNLGLPRYRRRTKPVVVAVQGITYTLGIELMLAADIVVAAVGQFKYRVATVEVVTDHEASGFELGQNTVNRGQTDVLARFHQRLVDVLGTHVTLLGRVEHLQDLDPWQGHFEAGFA